MSVAKWGTMADESTRVFGKQSALKWMPYAQPIITLVRCALQTGFLDSISLRGGPSPTASTNFASKLCHMQVIYNHAHDRKAL
jgi:hypothetical protein